MHPAVFKQTEMNSNMRKPEHCQLLKISSAMLICLISVFPAWVLAQKDTPCECAQRWTRGGHWEANGTVNDASNAPPPLGIVRCGSSAETMSNVKAKGCVYNSSQFQINPAGCKNPDTRLPVSITPPAEGCPVIWLNFDQRPAAGSYQFQIVSSETYSWALYYSSEHQNGIDASGLSGDCGSLIFFACGNSFTGWATFATPAFLKATNLYIAIWKTSGCGTQSGFSVNFKARYGCGDADLVLCNLETAEPTLSCNSSNGTSTVSIPLFGINGNYQGYDPNATPATSNIVTLTNLGSGGPISGTIIMTYPQSVAAYNIEIKDVVVSPGDISPVNPSECTLQVAGSGLNCDDGNPNTLDECVNGVCIHTCHDGNACTDDSEVNGICVFTNISCNDGDACTTDDCSPAAGCTHVPINCDDGNPQTSDGCENGICTHSCDDGNLCTTDFLNGAGKCIFEQKCNDTNACTTDNCNPATGACTNTPVNCDDGNPQSNDACINGVCVHTCDDGNTCTFDSYAGGNCIFSANCDDSDPCSVDECVNSVCVHTPFCNDDNNPCTDDYCRFSVNVHCVYIPKECSDNIACTVDACNPASGSCTHDESPCVSSLICPSRLIIVLDESGSIAGHGQGSVGVTTQVRSGVAGMFTAISETEINVAVIEFNSTARRAVINGTTAYQKITPANLSTFLAYINDNNSTPDNNHFDPEDYLSVNSTTFTNWDAALRLVHTINNNDGLAPLVLFFTDGKPTAYNNANGTVTTGTGTSTVNTALAKAVESANAVKAQGSHIFVVAFPNPTLPEGNVQAISGPSRYPDIQPDFTRADYSIESSTTLENSLKAIAGLLCRADLRLAMKVSPANACPGSSVIFTVQITNDGLDKADVIQVKNYLPSGYTYVSNNKGALFAGGIITWNVGALISTKSDSIKITAGVNQSGSYKNVAEVYYSNKPDNDSDPGNFSGTPDEDDEAAVSVSFQNCNGGGGCAAHADCNDFNACTSDICSGGVCQNTAINCNDGNSCTTDGCNLSTGCTHTPIANCGGGGSCAGVNCDDGKPCTADACFNGVCSNTLIQGMVISFTLVNSATDADIGALSSGAVINLAQTPDVNVRANLCTNTGTASVKFNLNGSQFKIENSAPWALAGDASGNYNKWNVTPGTYTIQAIPYTGSNATGTAGTSLSVTITVISGAAKMAGTEQNNTAHNALINIYPNPFRDELTFEFQVPEDSDAALELFTASGAKIATIFEGKAEGAVLYKKSLHLNTLPGGIYICRLKTKTAVITEKLLQTW